MNENQMDDNKHGPSVHKPDEMELLFPRACWIAGFCSGWPHASHLHSREAVHCRGSYDALLRPWW